MMEIITPGSYGMFGHRPFGEAKRKSCLIDTIISDLIDIKGEAPHGEWNEYDTQG